MSQHADELTAALEKIVDAARAHLERVREADGRVDDESVWRAYVSLNNAACAYDDLLREAYDEVTPWDLQPLDAEDANREWPGLTGPDDIVEPDPEPTVISVRQRRDYLVPSTAALLRTAEQAREEVPDPQAADLPVRGVGDAVLELLHAGDGSLNCLEVAALTPLDGVVVVNEVAESLEVRSIAEGDEDSAFIAGRHSPVVGRLDERSYLPEDEDDDDAA